ncbi:MAG: hypothetical protein ABIJ97_06050, partial [Bacteroidota bacterium]
MNSEPHKSIDVNVFSEILKKKYFIEENNESSKDNLIEIIRKIHKMEVHLSGIEINQRLELAKINIRRFGFREKTDVKFEFKPEVFDDETVIFLVPQKIYEMEDKVKLPVPYCEKGKMLQIILEDAFERLKVKALNILHNAGNDDQIIHYARKNIQMAQRICYEARIKFEKIQHTKNCNAIFMVYMQNAFMINVLSYLQKMFSSYYKDCDCNKSKYKADMYDAMDVNIMMEPNMNFRKSEIQKEKDEEYNPKIICNDQINILTTIFYDLMHKKVTGDKNFLEAESRDIQEIIHRFFVDKNGLPINKDTVETYMRESKEERRAKG